LFVSGPLCAYPTDNHRQQEKADRDSDAQADDMQTVEFHDSFLRIQRLKVNITLKEKPECYEHTKHSKNEYARRERRCYALLVHNPSC